METVKKFIKEHPHMWWGLYLPVYLTMFFIIEHLITDNYWATQTAIDDYIPFCEWFIFPYDAWGLPAGGHRPVPDRQGRRGLPAVYVTIMITFTTATVFCALVPNGQDLRPAVMEHHNIAAWLLQNTYALDTNTNVFPSVHVLGVIAAVSAVWHTPSLRKWGWRAGSPGLGIVIIAATLFVKQHAFIDVLAGPVCGGFGRYHRVRRHRKEKRPPDGGRKEAALWKLSKRRFLRGSPWRSRSRCGCASGCGRSASGRRDRV